MTGHIILLVVLMVLTPCMFTVTMVFNFLASNNNSALYQSSTGDVSDKYRLDITPSSWTFSIWGFIYAWQALWIVYAIVGLFRKTDQGPLYTNPILLSIPFFAVYLLNLVLNCTWMIVFDREVLEAAFVILFLMVVTLAICLVLSYRALDQNMDILTKQGRKMDVWLTRAFVHNGLSMYATWCTIATLLNLAFVLGYRVDGISQHNGSTVSLAILTAVIVAFIITDWFFLDRYTRYTLTPYLVLIIGLTGVTTNNWEEGARNSIFTLVLLAICGVAALVKCVLTIWRHFKRTTVAADVTTEVTKDGLKV